MILFTQTNEPPFLRMIHWNVTYLKVIAIVLSRFKNNLNDSIISMLQYNKLEMPRRFRIHIKRL